MCAALGTTRQGHCARKGRPPGAHAMRDEELAGLVTRARSEVRGIYGAPKAFFAPRRMGVRASMRRVARIMRERGWRGVARVCAKRLSGGNRAAKRGSVEELVKRKFSADGHNMARLADITCVKTLQGRLHPAPAMDIWSRRIAGRLMGSISSPWGNAAMEALMGIVKSGRACAGLRHARGGRAGHLRVHRDGAQPGEDPLGTGLHEPGRVRGGQLAGWRRPPEGGVEGVKGIIGVDSDPTRGCPSW